jgi:integrase
VAKAKRRGNNEGSITRRKDGRYLARITIGRDPMTGKLNRVSFYGKMRQEVADKLNRELSDRSRGTLVAPHKLTVGEWLDTWLRDYKRPTLRPISYDSYEMFVRVHLKPDLGHIPLKDLRPDQLQRFYNNKRDDGLSPRTIRYMHTILHGALKQAMTNQLVVRNVSEATTLPGGKTKTMHPLTLEQVQQFLTAVKDDRLFAAFFLEVGTGLRRGELLGLRWLDVDLDAGVVYVLQTLVWVRNHDATGSDRKTRLLFQEPKQTNHGGRSPSQLISSKC